jgi:hypothetical protein
MSRLWIFISKQSQVLEPSPQGVLRVVILRTLVGMRTGPLTRRSLSLARLMRSVETGGAAAGERSATRLDARPRGRQRRTLLKVLDVARGQRLGGGRWARSKGQLYVPCWPEPGGTPLAERVQGQPWNGRLVSLLAERPPNQRTDDADLVEGRGGNALLEVVLGGHFEGGEVLTGGGV